MRVAIGLLLAAVAAYALSFAIDMFLVWLVGEYPAMPFPILPMTTWWIIFLVASGAAWATAPGRPVLAAPATLLALVAFFAGIVGHRYNLVVAAALGLLAVGIGLGNKKVRATREKRQGLVKVAVAALLVLGLAWALSNPISRTLLWLWVWPGSWFWWWR